MKRKIILYTAVSLDGYITGENYDLNWLFSNEDYGYNDFIKTIDTTLMGRKTYEDVLGFGEFYYKNMENYVFTSDREFKGNGYVKIINSDPAEFVRALKDNPGKNIWLVGGGKLNSALLRAGFIDEMVLSYHPVVLGTGAPLFAPAPEQHWYKTLKTVTYNDGLIQVMLVRKQNF